MNKSVQTEELEVIHAIIRNLETCILGKSEEIRLMITALLADGHVLLEDVPGTGKTVLVKALAKTVQGKFQRIQCNPDLLPTDITGVSIYHPKREEFVFRPGPVVANILLVDEINRATTKTQSALLEAMEEKSISVDGEAYALPQPFLLLATQNPIDFEGTYLLPEAQLDRFMLKFQLGYPDEETERQMAATYNGQNPLATLSPVTNMEQFISIQQKVGHVHMDEAVSDYAIQIVRKTREHTAIHLGASPRATLALIQAAKAYAIINGRDYVTPDDVKYLAPYVLNHRMILTSNAIVAGESIEPVLSSIIEQVSVPVRLEQ